MGLKVIDHMPNALVQLEQAIANWNKFINTPDDLYTYSMRSEFSGDIIKFIGKCHENRALITTYTSRIESTDESYFEFKSPCELSVLQDVLRLIDDSHVMLQTLRQAALKDNSLTRNYDLL